jgi:hypothetical protein
MAKSFRRARALLLAGARAPSITGAAFMMIGSLHAYAMQSCTGMYSATLLQPDRTDRRRYARTASLESAA